MDPSYGFITAKYIKQIVESGERNKSRENIEFSTCGDSNFNFFDQAEVKRYGINNYTCLKNYDYEIFGNYYKDRMDYLELKLWKC
jgi:hypothetical protein